MGKMGRERGTLIERKGAGGTENDARQTEGSQGMEGVCVCREMKGTTHKTSVTQKSCLVSHP